jgi:hypothetical protein
MKILAIGNSFSQDATTYIEDIANSMGIEDITAANLYIPGCPLTKHAENLKTDELEYEYQLRGKGIYKTSIHAALASDDWDVITMQQVSGDSGLYDTFHPYIDELYAEVKRLCPNAKILLHRTWAYEERSGHNRFIDYGRNHEYRERGKKIGFSKAFPFAEGDDIEYMPEREDQSPRYKGVIYYSVADEAEHKSAKEERGMSRRFARSFTDKAIIRNAHKNEAKACRCF